MNKTVSELRSIGIPFLGFIPQKPPAAQVDLTVPLAGESDQVFAAIADNLTLKLKKRNQTILLTSPTPSSGKTYAATHLALALAAKKRSVALIDLDLRMPSIKSYLNLPVSQRGIEDLTRESRFRFGLAMDIFCADKMQTDPELFLESKALHNFISEQQKIYDFVILDTPPILDVVDAAIIESLSQAIVLVLRANDSQSNHLEECHQRLSGQEKRPVFAILNGHLQDADVRPIAS